MSREGYWNLIRVLLSKGLEKKEVFQEPADWQTRLMRRVRSKTVEPLNSFEFELASLAPYVSKLSIAALLLAVCMQSYVWHWNSRMDQEIIANLTPSFSANEILWGDR